MRIRVKKNDTPFPPLLADRRPWTDAADAADRGRRGRPSIVFAFNLADLLGIQTISITVCAPLVMAAGERAELARLEVVASASAAPAAPHAASRSHGAA
jgi:hypothetical protein